MPWFIRTVTVDVCTWNRPCISGSRSISRQWNLGGIMIDRFSSNFSLVCKAKGIGAQAFHGDFRLD